MEVSQPGSQYGGPPPQNFPQASPVPPYAQSPYGQQQQQYQQYQPPPQKANPIAEALGALGLLFFLRRYRPGYRARRQSSGCCGCLVALVILLLIIGTPAYLFFKANPGKWNQTLSQIQHSNNGTGNTVDNGNGNGVTPVTQPPFSINQSVTYAGVNITIESVQQATIFTDDNNIPSDTNGMVRVKIKETNNSGQNASYFYSDIAHLVLPDKSSVAPTNEMQPGGPQNGTTRENWLDFAAPTSDKIDQMTLVLGTTQDAQISIPLTGNANLSAFQAKTVNPNIPISYAGLNWTLKTATSTLSASSKQATSGMRYVVLTFNVDNHTSGSVDIGFVSDYMRLKSGGIMNGPADGINTTLPLGINPNTTGVSGTVTFLMPGNDTAFTLIFLAIPSGIDPHSNVQVNTDFTI